MQWPRWLDCVPGLAAAPSPRTEASSSKAPCRSSMPCSGIRQLNFFYVHARQVRLYLRTHPFGNCGRGHKPSSVYHLHGELKGSTLLNHGKDFHSGRDKSLTQLVQGRNKPNASSSKALVFKHIQSASEITLEMVGASECGKSIAGVRSYKSYVNGGSLGSRSRG